MRRGLCALAIALACLVGVLGSAEPTAVAAPAIDVCEMSSCAVVTVRSSGLDGRGTITSEPAGIACTVTGDTESGSCEGRFLWSLSVSVLRVELTFRPAKGSIVKAGKSPKPLRQYTVGYNLENGSDVLVNWVGFELTEREMTVSTSGEGSGRVVIEDGKSCRTPCSAMVKYGTALTLKAIPDAGAAFKTWTGACDGQDATCKVTVEDETFANAVFSLADRSVDARVVSVRAGAGKRSRRVSVRLSLEEDVAVTLALGRNEKLLAAKKFARVREGERVLTLLVPPRVRRGPAKLRVELSDQAGNARVLTRTIVIPKREA